VCVCVRVRVEVSSVYKLLCGIGRLRGLSGGGGEVMEGYNHARRLRIEKLLSILLYLKLPRSSSG
jgi:hypothetical protein